MTDPGGTKGEQFKEQPMRAPIVAVLAGLLGAGIAQACDDHHGACEIEDWRWYSVADYLTVEGVATCDTGHIRVRLYEGEGEGEGDKPKFLGTAEGFIEGHSFEAIGMNIQPPESVSIKYSIEPMG